MDETPDAEASAPRASLSDGEEIAARFAANRAFAIHSSIAIFLALAERGAVDAKRVFELNRVFAAGFRGMHASGNPNPVAQMANALTADMLEEWERAINNMITIPAGAGRA
jgi:hypothetical protein